jgi:hypothetical protein
LSAEDRLAAVQRISKIDRHALVAGELCGDREGLREKPDKATCAFDGLAVAGAEFLEPEERSDLLQLAVLFDHTADFFGDDAVPFADDGGVQHRRRAGQRIDSRVETFEGHLAAEYDGAVEVGKGLGHGWVSKIVGWHIDRLDRGYGGAPNRGDAFLLLGDFGGERRLVADT